MADNFKEKALGSALHFHSLQGTAVTPQVVAETAKVFEDYLNGGYTRDLENLANAAAPIVRKIEESPSANQTIDEKTLIQIFRKRF